MLSSKQQFSFAKSSSSHRRTMSSSTSNPSIHHVQPTRTPGLILIPKPQPYSQRIKPSQSSKQQQQQQSQPQQLPLTKFLSEESDKAVETTPKKRGRQPNKPKDSPRSSSRRRNYKARQPSPSLDHSLSSQAEDKSNLISNPISKSNFSNDNTFDPFHDNFSRRTSPKLTSRPSGKLARRRQQPASTSKGTNNNKSKRSLSPIPFPVCDDSDDLDGLDDFSPPSTPTRTPAQPFEFSAGPKSAPLRSSMPSFPFHSTPSPPKRTRPPRRHKRVPSEGIFPNKSDDELATSSSSAPSASGSDELKSLLGLLARAQKQAGSSQSDMEVEKVRQAIAGHFASSTFQNSPGPDELPPPAF